MKLAFVIRLGTDSRPSENFFEGCVEEVDSCAARRFHSTAELLSFLGERFNEVARTTLESGGGKKKSSSRKSKNCRETNGHDEPGQE